jgi:type IV pilus assembly protein PilC
MSKSDDKPKKLTDAEAMELGARLADLAQVDLPLAPGLLAASDEIASEGGSHNLADAMRELAGRIESGARPDALLESASEQVPPHLAAIIQAGVRCGHFDETLNWFVGHQRARSRVRRQLAATMTYPTLLYGILFCVFLFFSLVVAPAVEQIMLDFGAVLPSPTMLLFWITGYGWIIVVGLIVLLVCVYFGLRLIGGIRAVHRTRNVIPVLGRLYWFNGLAEFGSLLGLLTRHGLPLPDALSIASKTLPDSALGCDCETLSRRMSDGETMASGLSATSAPMQAISPVIQWGEQHGTLADVFEFISANYSEWAEIQSDYVRLIIPPITFIVIVWPVLFMVIGMFLPLIEMIKTLT